MQIFSLFGEILLKDSGVSGKLDEIDKKASGTSKSMGLSFSSIAGAALKLGSIIGVSLGFKSMIDGASASQQKLAQMDAVLKSTGGAAGMTKDELIKLADAQGKLTTFSKGANIETENLLLTFTGIGKTVFPDALKTVNDMSKALGQDTKSSAIQLGKALNDPINGMTALKRVGVNFTDAQKEQIKTMQEAGNVEGSQKLILQELQKEFGGSAEAAGKTFAGQMTILKNQISGTATQLGSVLIPYLTDFVTKINAHMPEIKQVITDVINTVVPKFQEWIKLIGQIVNELLPSFGKTSDDTKGKVTDLAKNGLNFVTDALTWIRDNIGIVKDGVIALTTVWLIQKGVVLAHNIALAAHNTAQFIKNVQDKIETGQIIALYVAEGIHNGITWASVAAQKALNLVMSMNTIGLVILAITALAAGFVLLYNKSETFRNFVNALWDNLKKFAAGVKEGAINLKNSIVNTVTGIKDAIVNGFNTAISFITGLPAKALQWGKDFIQGFINGITSMISSVTNAVKSVASAVTSFLHFSKPDQGPLADYETWMPDFMSGMAKGIEANKYKLTDAIKGIGTDMKVNVKGSMVGASNSNQQQTVDKFGNNPIQIILNSPTALSPAEVARQTKRSLQELALQF